MGKEIPYATYPSNLVGHIPSGLPTPDSESFGELDEAQTRYYILNGIVDANVISVESAIADHTMFAHFRTPGAIDSHNMVDFMQAVTGLPGDGA